MQNGHQALHYTVTVEWARAPGRDAGPKVTFTGRYTRAERTAAKNEMFTRDPGIRRITFVVTGTAAAVIYRRGKK